METIPQEDRNRPFGRSQGYFMVLSSWLGRTALVGDSHSRWPCVSPPGKAVCAYSDEDEGPNASAMPSWLAPNASGSPAPARSRRFLAAEQIKETAVGDV